MTSAPLYITKLQSVYLEKKKINPRYSLGSFASSLGISKSNLSRILNSQRSPNSETMIKLAAKLQLKAGEKRAFIRSAIESSQSKVIQENTVAPVVAEITNEDYEIMGEWYHAGLMELLLSEGFRYDIGWISKRLGLTKSETSIAINRLIRLKTIEEKTVNGKITLVRTSEKFTSLDKSKTSPLLRQAQKQLLEKAIHSLENDPIEMRTMRSLTVSINPEQLSVANQMIQEFMRNLCDVLECGPQKEVYNLSLSLYPLTRSEKP